MLEENANGNRPFVSIGMPVYNGEEFLGKAIECLLAQDFADIELIISNNASTDNTKDICLSYAKRDGRIVYIEQHNQIAAYENFNSVFRKARGQYFMWAADDDLWEQRYISTLVNSLEEHPDAVLAFCTFDNVDGRGREIKRYPEIWNLRSASRSARMWKYIMQDEYAGKANLIYGLMRRDALEKVGGFKVWGRGIGGIELFVVFQMLSYGELVLAEELLFHKRVGIKRKHRESSSMKGIRKILPYIESIGRWGKDWRNDCFVGYMKLIKNYDGINWLEKMVLKAAILWRWAQLYGQKVWQDIIKPFFLWFRKRVLSTRA